MQLNSSSKRPYVVDCGVAYYAGTDFVVCVRSPLVRVKICRLTFGTDGSLYVSFPYLREKRGILAEIRDPETAVAGQPVTYDLAESGVAVPTDVKFSHHASGVVGFSLTGLPTKLPRRKAFSLADGEGVVFQLHAHHLSGFAWSSEKRRKDVYLEFGYADQHPFALKVTAHWWRKSTVARDAVPNPNMPSGAPPGPRVQAFHRATGKPQYFFFIGPNAKSAIQDHIVAVSMEAAPVPTGSTCPGMVFVGGSAVPGTHEAGSALAFMYPYRGTCRTTLA